MPLLEISHLSKSFGGQAALSDFSLRLAAGEKLALIGPNGAGKTTVLNLISGFYRPDQGRIVFQQTRIDQLPPHRIAALGLSRTFQNIRLWDDLSVLDNVRLAFAQRPGLWDVLARTATWQDMEQASHDQARAILKRLDLASQSCDLPANLPYGLRRRVELARALAGRPKLLLLDEPAAGLTPGETDQLTKLILDLHAEFNFAILLIEHRMKMVMTMCDRISVLDFGQTIAEGSPAEIRDNPEVVEAYLGKPGAGGLFCKKAPL